MSPPPLGWSAWPQAPLKGIMNSLVWHNDYHGALSSEDGACGLSRLSAFHFRPGEQLPALALQESGTYFGFVMEGEVTLRNAEIRSWTLQAGQWFSIPLEMTIENANLATSSRVVVIFQKDYHGVYAMGGPVEKKGRLRYIDGCSDSLLLCPPELGDPCLNLLHFPKHIKQTMHNHPSARMGAVISGQGLYVTKDQQLELKQGSVFYIPTDTYHHFETADSTLNVFAFHPDSDWGPQDEFHPMINRTWVNGKRIDNVIPNAPHLL